MPQATVKLPITLTVNFVVLPTLVSRDAVLKHSFFEWVFIFLQSLTIIRRRSWHELIQVTRGLCIKISNFSATIAWRTAQSLFLLYLPTICCNSNLSNIHQRPFSKSLQSPTLVMISVNILYLRLVWIQQAKSGTANAIYLGLIWIQHSNRAWSHLSNNPLQFKIT